MVLEATYGWYWAADVLASDGASVHLAHPLGVKAFAYRRVKNDVRYAADLADLLRMGRLPEAWIAPPATRALREQVRHRAKLVALRSGLKAQVHAVLAKQGVAVPVSDLFGVAGGDRGGPAHPQGRRLAGRHPRPVGRAPWPQHRRRGHRRPATDPRLLRVARRAHPRTGPARSGSGVNQGTDAVGRGVVLCHDPRTPARSPA